MRRRDEETNKKAAHRAAFSSTRAYQSRLISHESPVTLHQSLKKPFGQRQPGKVLSRKRHIRLDAEAF